MPVMIRLAPRLRLLDQPSGRKVHARPVPRVGGWGITLGALSAILLWMPTDPVVIAFSIGAVILLVGGALDDSRDLQPFTKLLVQGAAVMPALLHAGLWVATLPLIQILPLPPAAAMVFTGIWLAACINATNTADGLDGLAAGVTLLSLAGILYLAFVNENTQLLLITVASLGGLAGFLRYNTYPAAAFMGDAGSQFLGFTLGFLGLALVQPDASGPGPWTMLPLMGLPLADLAVVALRRLLRGVHCFQADRTHIHHRLLDLGLTHNQSVGLIHVMQASLVCWAVLTASSPPWIILLGYGLHLAIIYGVLVLAETCQRNRCGPWSEGLPASPGPRVLNPVLVRAPRVLLEMLIPAMLLWCAASATSVPTDFGILALLVLVPMLTGIAARKSPPTLVRRVQVFTMATAVVYLYTEYRPFADGSARLLETGGIAVAVIAAGMALGFTPGRRKREFRTTAMDYLIVMIVILAFFALQQAPTLFSPYFLLYLPVVLYGSEIIMVERRERPDWLQLGTILTAGILMIRGLPP